jgi:cytochrome c oxidase cbb3-type subunit 2
MDYFNDHRRLYLTALALFVFLTLLVVIIPAISNQRNNGLLPGYELPSEEVVAGKALYIANGCVACHTQQVRDVAMDEVWGERPGMAADYAGNHRVDFWRNTATLMGTERTGPDLTSIGTRQPSRDWHLLHLYQPRAVVKESVMPAHPWLFEEKEKVGLKDVEVNVPDEFKDNKNMKVVARKEALQLIAYLQSLKQIKIYSPTVVGKFLYKDDAKLGKNGATAKNPGAKGQNLYAQHCQSCHQSNGEGLKGAFPPLKGSAIVKDDNPELQITIIMKGYDARPEYGVMPAVGENANLTAEQISAIVNHERSSWGNNARNIPAAEVQKIMDMIKKGK